MKKGEAEVLVEDLVVGGRFQETEKTFSLAKCCEISVYSHSASPTPIIFYLQAVAKHTVECACG
jgi:hypothetical protein